MHNLQITKLQNSDEYQTLIQDCISILTERIYRSRLEIVIAHGELGERIVNDPLYKRYKRGLRKEFLENIAEQIGISYSEINRSIKFYQKFKITDENSEGWNKIGDGKNISWYKIKTYYLPENGKPPHNHLWEKVYRCKICRKIINQI